MKKICLFFLFPYLLMAGFIEVRTGLFYPQDKTFREIYGSLAFLTGVELDLSLLCRLHVWGEASYLHKSGTAHEPVAKSHVTLVPLSAGLKYIHPIDCRWDCYLKGGPSWYYLHTSEGKPYSKKSFSKVGSGALFGTGFIYHVSDSWFVDMFFSYLYTDKRFSNKTTEIPLECFRGGFLFGLEGGIAF